MSRACCRSLTAACDTFLQDLDAFLDQPQSLLPSNFPSATALMRIEALPFVSQLLDRDGMFARLAAAALCATQDFYTEKEVRLNGEALVALLQQAEEAATRSDALSGFCQVASEDEAAHVNLPSNRYVRHARCIRQAQRSIWGRTCTSGSGPACRTQSPLAIL